MLSRSLGKIFLLSFVVLVCMHRLVRPPRAAVVGRAFSSHTAELVVLRARGAPFPKGRAEMYRAFLRDVKRDAKRNDAIPPRPRLSPRNPRLAALELPKPARRPRGLRVMSFNVHFWQRGYSSRLHGDNQEACVEAVRRHQPDVLLLQEVVPTDVAAGGALAGLGYDALGALARLGYIHRVMVAAPEVHAHRMPTACAPVHCMRTTRALDVGTHAPQRARVRRGGLTAAAECHPQPPPAARRAWRVARRRRRRRRRRRGSLRRGVAGGGWRRWRRRHWRRRRRRRRCGGGSVLVARVDALPRKDATSRGECAALARTRTRSGGGGGGRAAGWRAARRRRELTPLHAL